MRNLDNDQNKKTNRNFKKIILLLLATIVIAVATFIIYELATVNNTYYIGEKNLQIPIFVYHDIVKDESEVEYDYMQTTVDKFEEQISGLMKLGYKPISYQDLVNYKNGKTAIPKWSFLITFDDGYMGIYENAFKIAKKYNIPMASFVIDDKVGENGFFSWEQAKEMNDSGLISIYSHGYTHAEYNKKSAESLKEDTDNAYSNLQHKLNRKDLLKVFTYPYGLYTDQQRTILGKEGYVQNLTDNKINSSKKLDLTGLHRCYPLDDSVPKILLKIQYRYIRYGA